MALLVIRGGLCKADAPRLYGVTEKVVARWRGGTGALLERFSSAECQNYLTNAGYASV